MNSKLASRCLHAGARILAPSGKEFSDDNIGNALATRELMADLRAYGVGADRPHLDPRIGPASWSGLSWS